MYLENLIQHNKNLHIGLIFLKQNVVKKMVGVLITIWLLKILLVWYRKKVADNHFLYDLDAHFNTHRILFNLKLVV